MRVPELEKNSYCAVNLLNPSSTRNFFHRECLAGVVLTEYSSGKNYLCVAPRAVFFPAVVGLDDPPLAFAESCGVLSAKEEFSDAVN